MKKFKVGDKISLINKNGIRDEAKVIDLNKFSICLQFKNWNDGHSGILYDSNRSCWFYGINELSIRKDIKIFTGQLEFNFNEKT